MTEKDNQEAERAAPCHNCCTITTCMEMGCGQGGAVLRAPAVGEDGLPPLPAPAAAFTPGGRAVKWDANYANDPWLEDGYRPLYTAGQYRQGQREAVTADRQARGLALEKLSKNNSNPAETRMDTGFDGAGKICAQLALKSQEGTCG